MHILYLHQFFTTREGTGGTRSYEFARHLAAAGHEVTMVTAARGNAAAGSSIPARSRSAAAGSSIPARSRSAAAGSSIPARSRTEPRRYDVGGFAVVEVRGGSPDYVSATAQGYARRIAGFGGFAVAATATAVKLPRPDVVFATSPALTVAVPGLLAARRHRAPLVFEVRDLWPRAPIEMGALPNPVAQALARGMEKAAYRGAAHVVALSPGMREGVVAAGVDPARVTLIPNAADLDLFAPDVDPGQIGERFGDDFVCSYFGTMGEANDLDQVVRAATVLADRGEKGVTFALMGDGKRRPALEEEVARRGLSNVVLLPAGDKAAAARLAAASDACLTVFKDVPVLATNSPNKLFDTFAAGRAAIVNTDGWQRELVEDNQAGVYVRPADPEDLADRVLALRDDPALVRSMGANARRLAEARFDRRDLAEQLRGVLERAAANEGTVVPGLGTDARSGGGI